MQNGTNTKRRMGTHRTPRRGPAVSKGSERKLSRPVGVRLIDAQKSYERYMALARTAGSAGDVTDIENYYQHAEHYFRLMKELAV